jgi:hypothetical protein
MTDHQNLNREADEIRKALKNIPYEILLKERQANLKVFEQHMAKTDTPSNKKSKDNESNDDFRRKSDGAVKHKKGRPVERSCKERPSQFKTIFDKPKAVYSDPRFEEHAGELSMSKFLKSYDFLKETKKAEIDKAESFLKSKKKIKKMDKQLLADIKSKKAENIQQVKQMENMTKKFEIKQQLKKDLQAKGISAKFIKKRCLIRKHREGI